MEVPLADQSLTDLQLSILDPDCNVASLGAGETEVEGRFETARLVRLEDVGHEVEQPRNGAWPQTTTYGLNRFVLELAPCYRFRVGARHYKDRLGTLLQRFHYLPEVP